MLRKLIIISLESSKLTNYSLDFTENIMVKHETYLNNHKDIKHELDTSVHNHNIFEYYSCKFYIKMLSLHR